MKGDSHIRPLRRTSAAYPMDVPQELQDSNLAQSVASHSVGFPGRGFYAPSLPFHPPMAYPAYPTYETLAPLQVPPNSPDAFYNNTSLSVPPQPLCPPLATDSEPSASPAYQTNRNGLPVNVSHGSVSVQPTTVFVKNIAPRATRADVESFFAASGKITRCELFLSAKNPRRGPKTAIVQFSNHIAAVDAYRRFNSFAFMERVIVVKLDSGAILGERRNGKASTCRGPIIADGSGGGEL